MHVLIRRKLHLIAIACGVFIASLYVNICQAGTWQSQANQPVIFVNDNNFNLSLTDQAWIGRPPVNPLGHVGTGMLIRSTDGRTHWILTAGHVAESYFDNYSSTHREWRFGTGTVLASSNPTWLDAGRKSKVTGSNNSFNDDIAASIINVANDIALIKVVQVNGTHQTISTSQLEDSRNADDLAGLLANGYGRSNLNIALDATLSPPGTINTNAIGSSGLNAIDTSSPSQNIIQIDHDTLSFDSNGDVQNVWSPINQNGIVAWPGQFEWMPNLGDSGGPLMVDGKVVGIASAIQANNPPPWDQLTSGLQGVFPGPGKKAYYVSVEKWWNRINNQINGTLRSYALLDSDRNLSLAANDIFYHTGAASAGLQQFDNLIIRDEVAPANEYHLVNVTSPIIEIGTLQFDDTFTAFDMNGGNISLISQGLIVDATPPSAASQPADADAFSPSTITRLYDGSINITGAPLIVGESGSARLTVESGTIDIRPGEQTLAGPTSVILTGDILIGLDDDSHGELIISGHGSVVDNTGYRTRVGASASTGFIHVVNGGQLTSWDLELGSTVSSSGNLTVDEGQVQIGHAITVGRAGSGEVSVSNGGTIYSDEWWFIADQSGSSASISASGFDPVTLSPSEITADTAAMAIGHRGHATMNITNGAIARGRWLELGSKLGGDGTVTVSGYANGVGPSTFHATDNIRVGWVGTGDLLIESGGLARSDGWFWVGLETGSTGAVTVSGRDVVSDEVSRLSVDEVLIVGNRGNGSLTLGDGAALDAQELSLGRLAGGVGSVFMTGRTSADSPQTRAEMSNALVVGWDNLGTIDMSGGAVTIAPYIRFAEDAGSDGTGYIRGVDAFTGAPTILQATVHLVIADNGLGYLEVSGGGQLDASGTTYAAIGNSTGSNGSLIITGDGSRMDADYLRVGHFGTGSMEISAGADVTLNDINVGDQTGGVGTLTVTGPGSTLTANARVIIGADAAATATATFSSGAVVEGNAFYSAIDGLDGQVTVNNAEWHNGALHIGPEGNGTLNVIDGTITTQDQATLGRYAGGIGNVTLSGNSALWTANGALGVGDGGEGELVITNGSKLDATGVEYFRIGVNEGSNGSITVSDEGSQLVADELGVGSSGIGSLTVSTGADVTLNNIVTGEWAGSEGTLAVTDPGSSLTANTHLIIGDEPNSVGTATFSNGAVIDGTGFYNAIATEGGTGQVTVDNAEWHTGEFHVGQRGNGTLIVTDGIITTSNFATIGRYDIGVGVATITGPNADWAVNGTLAVGPQGSGELYIENGASVSSQTLYISDLAGAAPPNGLVDVDGTGSLLTAENAYIGRANITAATLEAGNNAVVEIAGTLELGQTGTLTTHSGGLIQIGTPPAPLGDADGPFNSGVVTTGDGTLDLRGLIEGDLNNDGTVIAYKNTPVGITGSYIQTANGTLDLTLVNSNPSLGVVNFLGDAQLDGTLSLTLLSVLSPGATVKILAANSVTGQFTNVTGTDIGNDLALRIIYQSDAVVVEVIEANLSGDLNGDGFVGIADLNIVLGNWNQTVPPADPAADPSGDNFVGIADLNEVLGNWNAGTPPNWLAPEPNSVLVSGLLAMIGIYYRTRDGLRCTSSAPPITISQPAAGDGMCAASA